MRYVSLFSGIEAASVAWKPLGWEPIAFAEIEPFPCAVLAKRFPDVPNLGDVSKIDWNEFKETYGAVDPVVGGSPCQSFSIAGKREGLGGASGLMYEYIRAVQELRPRWFVWENVPGSFSVERGHAFWQLLTSLDECGYGLAWRVLDAQFCRVPRYSDSGELAGFVGPVAQRRRRVFLVGCATDGCAAEVLLEPEGMRGDLASGRDKRTELARAAGRGATSGGGACLNPWDVQSKRIYAEEGTSPTLPSGSTEGMNIQPSILTAAGFKYHQGSRARGIGFEPDNCPTLTADFHNPAVLALDCRNDRSNGDVSGTLQAKSNGGQSLNYQNPVMVKVHCGSDTYTKPDGSMGTAGKGALTSDDVAFTLATAQDQTLFTMVTSNTTSHGLGVSDAQVSPTLDTSGGV